jgi:hypothetical protein
MKLFQSFGYRLFLSSLTQTGVEIRFEKLLSNPSLCKDMHSNPKTRLKQKTKRSSCLHRSVGLQMVFWALMSLHVNMKHEVKSWDGKESI